ncbi:MAG: DUF456 domain-containing protein [Bacteroidales bacterium]|nr:DUF456 domain-containing protein [Bacteroidales bacterium]
MDTILIILAFFSALVGIVGAVVPGLPGPPFAWLAVLLQSFTRFDKDLTPTFLIVTAILAVIITVLDYVIPAWGTKRYGGTPSGTKGSTIGLLVSVFLLPFLGITIGPFGIIGILLGPFAGAYIGERMHQTDSNQALRSAFGSFMGFLAGTFIKLVFAIVIVVIMIKGMF